MKPRITMILLMSATTAAAWQSPTGPPAAPSWRIGSGMSSPEPKKEKNPLRTLTGVVFAPGDTPVPRALVTLKNNKTLAVKTFITNDTGAFQFSGLSPNADYEICAESNGARSATKTLSSFDNREKPVMNLHITPKPKTESKVEETKK